VALNMLRLGAGKLVAGRQHDPEIRLLGGDAEEGVWDALAAESRLPDVEVLKVAHHGSHNGLSPQALAQMRPEIALVSVGRDNRFGHPDPEAVELLQTFGAEVHRTDLEGDLSVRMDRPLRCATMPAWQSHRSRSSSPCTSYTARKSSSSIVR
jgi:beta-lactamase superfamily II metal-dependent hydrolase